MSDAIEIKPSELQATINMVHNSNKTLPPHLQLVLFVQSAPGIGKSNIIQTFAKEIGKKFIDTRLSYAAPTDVRGFPYITGTGSNKSMKFAPPCDYPTTPGNVWLLDEYTCASKATQMAALQLILDKKVGEYEVPADTLLILAGNRPIDRANVERLSSANVNRIVQVTLRADLDDFEEWASSNDIDPRIIAYTRFRPELLSDFDASKWDGTSGFASPRSWSTVNSIISGEGFASVPRGVQQALILGAIGPAAGSEFASFLDTCAKLPDMDEVLKNPGTADIPSDPSTQVALVAALVSRFEKKNIPAIIEFTDRMRTEFQVLTIRMGVKADKEKKSLNEPALVKWMTDPKNQVIFSS